MDDVVRIRTKEILIWLAAFLACVTPRFIPMFKINLGIHVSYYALTVVLVWILYAKRELVPSVHLQELFFYVLLLHAAVSIVQNMNLNRWLFYIYYITICILMMNTLITNNEDAIYEGITVAVCLALLIQVVIGIYEVSTHTYVFRVGSFSVRHYGKEAVSMFSNPNDYSTYVTTLVPFAVYRVFASRRILAKVLYLALAAGAIDMIVVTASRACIAALAFAVLALVFLAVCRDRRRIAIVAPTLLIACAAAFLLVPALREWLLAFVSENSIDTSGEDVARVNLLKNGLHFLYETCGIGVGAGNLEVWFEKFSIFHIGELLYIHNWYAEILVTFGIFIFAFYVLTHISLLVMLYRNAKEKDGLFGIHTCFFLSFLIFSVTSISSSSNVYSEWVWMFLAVTVAYCEKNRKKSLLRVELR
ncbi:MAG: O-antigen ligase family protein [Eubacteriales bacterium]|nr:O-antigen ligase family protein [Eubacteriales bacterium]